MKKSPGRPKNSEAIIKDVKRVTRRQFNPEEKIAIVLEGLSGEQSIAEICRREGIAHSVYYNNERYHESLENCTPASVYFGTHHKILKKRQILKQKSMKQRRVNHMIYQSQKNHTLLLSFS